MTDLVELSTRIIEDGDLTTRPNRVTNELSEVADGVAVVESFSHCWAIDTGDGLVVIDASGVPTGGAVTKALRRWRRDPVRRLVYTHGHVDHVGGSGALLADGRARGQADPDVIGHANVEARFERYELTNGYNLRINARQFGPARRGGVDLVGDAAGRFLPADTARCTTTYGDRLSVRTGRTTLELRHDRGETDDHTWLWDSDRRAIFSGDFVTWVFPNAGNPQKVQRYPSDWAGALRRMAALEPELLLPAHGLPIGGRDRIRTVLDNIATALEGLVAGVLELMNDGRPLDEIVREVHVPRGLMALPYLQPVYDEPEFVVRNIWRQYGGWWDGNPARLKPPADDSLAAEVATLSGGAVALARRARALAGTGDLRLACQLVEWARTVAPDDVEVRGAHREIYDERRRHERSLMAKGVYADAAAR